MKIVVTSKGDDISSVVDPRFGRCPYFIVVDPDSLEFKALKNKGASAMSGAGPQAASQISQTGVEVLITGNVGPKAYQALEAAKIKVITGASGTVKEALARFKNGELQETRAASTDSHSGMS